jgi:small subunit ribosomal protein S1
VDDVIQAKVINVSRQDKKIGLSIRKLEESEEKEIYKNYLNNPREATSNLGELLKKGMINLQNHSSEDHPGEDDGSDKSSGEDLGENGSSEIQSKKMETF